MLTTPVIRCVKKQLGATVHFLSKSSFAAILESNPYIDQVHTFDQEISPELLATLKAEQYDQVLDLHHNLRTLRLKWALGRPASSFNKLNLEKWLLVNLHLNRLPDTHIVHRYMDTAKHLGVTYDGAGLDYFIPKSTSLATIPLPTASFIALAIGATHATKRLPESKILEICKNLPFPVVLLGGKAEQALGNRIASALGSKVLDLCGQLSLHQSAQVLALSSKVITHDTGLMHIAAALQKPIISVWGSTVPAFGMWPFYPTGLALNTSVEVLGLACRPCSKIGFDACPKKHFDCMRKIEVDTIIQACL